MKQVTYSTRDVDQVRHSVVRRDDRHELMGSLVCYISRNESLRPRFLYVYPNLLNLPSNFKGVGP